MVYDGRYNISSGGALESGWGVYAVLIGFAKGRFGDFNGAVDGYELSLMVYSSGSIAFRGMLKIVGACEPCLSFGACGLKDLSLYSSSCMCQCVLQDQILYSCFLLQNLSKLILLCDVILKVCCV